MARISLSDARVRELVDRKLVPLFLAERSTLAMCKSLNDLLGHDAEGTIHPNRLHALLSDDIARGVNDATIGLVERALQALDAGDPSWVVRSDKRLAELRAEVRHLREARHLADPEIARLLGVPPAVARCLLSKDGLLTHLDSTGGGPRGRAKAHKPSQPDWAFQDVAVANCLDALRQRPHSKVGLILPTGAGKTRTALRIVLQQLARTPDATGLVYWVTHRTNLRTQAHRELQKLLSTGKDQLPPQAAALLANRIKFVMVSELPQLLADDTDPPVLVIVDEAHHAAAPSYQPIFTAKYPLPALFLTATPNRTDLLPIGIDEIAFTITYRELEERRCIVMPQFDPFPVDDFEWSEGQVKDLADYVIDRCEQEFSKVLILAPRIDRVEEFYEALQRELDRARLRGHPLDLGDVGYIHGAGNSLHIDNDEFLDVFAKKPRAIMVSAQLLLEGFDDPAIDTVVLTYPTQSLVRLMQAAGRCVRYSPGKNKAYVIQARKDELAYYFDQRWLYQEISDYLRPELIDIDYASLPDLQAKVTDFLARHNVKEGVRKRVLTRLADLVPGRTCRLLCYGLPYYGAPERFDERAEWGTFLEDAHNCTAFRGVFNSFSEGGATLSDPSDFLTRECARYGIPKDVRPGSMWAEMMGVLTAAHLAREEIYGSNTIARHSRPSKRHGPTSWLRYVTFHFRPLLPLELSDFIADCYNRESLATAYLEDAQRHALAIKIPLPLGDAHEGWLLSPPEAQAFESASAALLGELEKIAPAQQFGTLAAFLASSDDRALPARVLLRLEAFVGPERTAARVLRLPDYPLQIEGSIT